MPGTHGTEVDAQHRDWRRWVLAALMCTMMLAAMDTTIVSTAIAVVMVLVLLIAPRRFPMARSPTEGDHGGSVTP